MCTKKLESRPTRPNLLRQSFVDTTSTHLGTVECDLPLENPLTYSGWVLIKASIRFIDKAPIPLPALTFNIHTQGSKIPREFVSLTPRKQSENNNFCFKGITKIYADKDESFKVGFSSPSHALQFAKVSLQPISRFEAIARLLFPRLKRLRFTIKQFPHLLLKIHRLLRTSGFAGLKARLRREFEVQPAPIEYHQWIQAYDTLTDTDRTLIRARIEQFKIRPKISIVMPVYNIAEQWLRRAIESVQKQLYTNWELCIADDCSSQPHIAPLLKEFAQQDARIKFVIREKNGHISAASNSALELATGEFIALLDHDDEMPEHALYFVAQELNDHPDTDIIYSDEDKIDELGRRMIPTLSHNGIPISSTPIISSITWVSTGVR